MIKLLHILAACMLVSLNVSAFSYPTGIPNAWMSPDIPKPEAPSDWSVEIPNKYYINNQSALCDDDFDYGTPAVPRCRTPSIFPAGAYVELHGEGYDYTTKIYLKSYGTEANPVWLVGGSDLNIKASLTLTGRYLFVDGLNITGGNGITVIPYQDIQTDNVMIRNSKITGNGTFAETNGIKVTGIKSLPMTNFIFYNNEVSYMGQWDAIPEKDNHGIEVGTYLQDVWLLNNVTHHNGGDGVQFSHGGVDAGRFYYGGNLSYNERENCVDIKHAYDVVISTNICHGIRLVGSAEGAAMVIHQNAERVTIINNEIYDAVVGIISTIGFDLHISGNYIHDLYEKAADANRGDISTYQSGVAINVVTSGSATITNNTIERAVRGIAIETLNISYGYKYVVTGNIISDLIYGQYSGNSPYSIMIKGDDDVTDATPVDGNLFNNPMRVLLNNDYYDSAASINESRCTGCINADPMFVSAEDRRLSSSSPAIDAGVASTSYKWYEDYYGKSIANDSYNIYRELLPDIGAFESNGAFVSRDPVAPTSFYIDVINDSLVWNNENPQLTDIELLKNDVSLGEDIANNATGFHINGVSNSNDTYQLKMTNALGSIYSSKIYSDVVSVTPINGNLDYQLSGGNLSYYIPRAGALSGTGNISIVPPEFKDKSYGTSYSKTKFRQESGEELTGYVYTLGMLDNEIEGAIFGDGTVNIFTIDNSYSDDIVKSKFSFNDSVVEYFNNKKFQQNKISIKVNEQLNYVFKPTTNNIKSAIGISGIVESE